MPGIDRRTQQSALREYGRDDEQAQQGEAQKWKTSLENRLPRELHAMSSADDLPYRYTSSDSTWASGLTRRTLSRMYLRCSCTDSLPMPAGI